jgi:hypothetical protein
MSDKPTLTDMMVAYAQDAVDMANANFGEQLDYSESSIRGVESCLKNLHESLPKGFFGRLFGRGPSPEQIETVAKMFGAYVGEVFRKHHGGEWILDDQISAEGRVLAVQHSSGGKFFPPAKVFKRLANGDEDNVWIFYQILTREYIGKDGSRQVPGDS